MQDWTLSGIREVSEELVLANTKLHVAMEKAFSRDELFVDGGFTWQFDRGTLHRE
jgi:hypothetical protein